MKNFHVLSALCCLFLLSCSQPKGNISIVLDNPQSERAVFAAEKLTEALEEAGYTVADNAEQKIVLGSWQSDSFRKTCRQAGWKAEALSGKEAFHLYGNEGKYLVGGSDESGVLYGALELCDRLEADQKLPKSIDFQDAPEMVLRGTCIGVQKTYFLPGRQVYEYPYTEKEFPWFYDKELWIEYLDMLVENRMNSLYLWNGHPFASLVKLPDYPYALEVSEEDFKKNEEIFSFLTAEANKRGIWVIQMFYNIIVSKPFAEYHGIPTQNRKVEITPLLSDYTRKSVQAFIEKYPNVGLLVCLGEAMNTWKDDVNWFTKTIIPGVQDGLKNLGITEEPPIVVRAHDTNCQMVMEAALPLYKNLYTMNKYNGESLCTYEPRGPWTETHRYLSSLGSVHVSNVHILANLEPFRYGSPDFIQKSVQAMHNVHGANALHLYPQHSYWDWPYAADRLPNGERLLEMDRDWIWYEAWARYAWKADRDRNEEITYWCKALADKYDCSMAQARNILTAYEETGEISTKLLRKFGITEGNRQTFLLGMFMSQLVNPNRWTVYPDFANSCGPEGEKLEVWAEREWKGQPHVGETPPQLIAETREHARKAAEAIRKVKGIKGDKDEFERLKNDILCYEAFTYSFDDKLEAAMYVLRYKYSNNVADLDSAYTLMESSLQHYRKLVDLTRDTYLYANSMQTPMRRIPNSGANAKNKEWWELLPQYEEELANFAANIEQIKNPKPVSTVIKPFKAVDVRLSKPAKAQFITVKEGEKFYTDKPYQILHIAPELQGLKAMRFAYEKQRNEVTELQFTCKEPVTLWIGYYSPISPSQRYMPAPKLETDASANQYGQADIKIANALEIDQMPAVNVHSYHFALGSHKLNLGKGLCLVLGFSEQMEDFKTRDAGLKESTAIDWLFY